MFKTVIIYKSPMNGTSATHMYIQYFYHLYFLNNTYVQYTINTISFLNSLMKDAFVKNMSEICNIAVLQ